MYKIKTMSKDEFIINENEFKQVANANGRIFLKSCNSILNTSMIESIQPEEQNKKENIGYLHDGEKVIKVFDRWVDFRNKEVRIDPDYYPEIAKDKVLTEQEYLKIKHLPKEERLKIVMNDKELKC